MYIRVYGEPLFLKASWHIGTDSVKTYSLDDISDTCLAIDFGKSNIYKPVYININNNHMQ